VKTSICGLLLLVAARSFGSIDKADVIVIGGTHAGVEAALAAQAAGANAALFESRPALGGDRAGKLLIEDDGGKLTTPLAIRQALDDRLLKAKLPFRTWVYVKDILRDAAGNVAGVTVVSRSGERIVPAKCVIDATERAYAARCAGSSFRPFPAGPRRVRRRVVSGERPAADGMTVRAVGVTGRHRVGKPVLDKSVKELEGTLWECEMEIAMRDGSPSVYAEMEQVAREKTWTRLQLESAETCILDAPDRLVRDTAGVVTCGAASDLDPAEAGRRAAAFAASAHPGRPVAGTAVASVTLAGRTLAVVGLGTGGAPALVCAARAGLRPVGFEYSYRCGGLTTEGLIGCYWFGNRVGFTAEIDAALPKKGVVYSQAKEDWFRASAVSCGAMVYFGSFAYGVEKTGSRISALKVMLADGAPARVPVETVVDATGNCDVAVAAGESTEFIAADELSLQGAAFMRKKLGASYLNLDWTFVNDCDAEDLWYLSLRGRNSYERNKRFWDQSQVIDTRERRRLLGLFRVTPQDVMLNRTYPDIVCITRSNFDTHGQTVDPQFLIKSTEHEPLSVNLPYRAILPRQTDNLAVIGLGLSASRDAMPILRMEPDVQNQGWVAAKACEYAVREGKALKDIDVKALQRDLVEKDVLPAWVLTATDNLPVSDARIDAAVAKIPDDYQGLPEVFSDPLRSVPLLERAYSAATNEADKVAFAHVLGMLGSSVGADTLAARLKGATWDEGWNYRGMDQFGRPVSQLDSYIIALAKSRARIAHDAVAALAAQLDDSSHYSHFRAIALYFDAAGDTRDAAILTRLLSAPGIGGHAFAWERDGAPAIPEYDVHGYNAKRADLCHGAASVTDGERSCCLRELILARALYRLGDKDGLAKSVLEAYTRDPRRAYAEHARQVLNR